MAWSSTQIHRLGIERDLLDRYFQTGVRWHNPTGPDTYVEIDMISNSSKEYTIRIYIEEDFPNSCPQMVMVSPDDLLLEDGSSLPDTSSSFHTIGVRDGYTLLCHFVPDQWTAENTLFQVFIKGRLWIEAYEGHLSTGKDMDVFLRHMDSSPTPSASVSQSSSSEEDVVRERFESRGHQEKKGCVIT